MCLRHKCRQGAARLIHARIHRALRPGPLSKIPRTLRGSEGLARFQYESEPVVFTEWHPSHAGRLHLACFQQKFQCVEIGGKLLFELLADQPLGYLEEAPNLSLD